LKDWRHFDGQVKNSFSGIQDPILYNVMWGAWDTAVANDSSAQGSNVSDGSDGVSRPAKNEFDEDDDGEMYGVGHDSGFMDGRKRLRPDPDEDEDEDEEGVPEVSTAAKGGHDRATIGGAGNKRKRTSGSSAASGSSRVAGRVGMRPGMDTKKYDLQKVARMGTGRVMFVFEKKKDSQMGDVGGEDSEE
jgi:hypothetical protein